MSQQTNYVVISTDFTASGSLGSATVDSSGALPALPLLKLPFARASLFHASGIAYTVSFDTSGVMTDYAATVSNVTPSVILTAGVNGTVGGAVNAWTNGGAANNVLDLSFNFKSKWTRLKFDVANAATLVGASTVGHHIAFLATNAVRQIKPTSTTSAFSAGTIATMAAAINTSVGARLVQVLGTQAVQDAILKTLAAANGPVLDPSGSRLPYDVNYSGISLVLYLYNFGCSITFPNQVAQTLTFDRLAVLLEVS